MRSTVAVAPARPGTPTSRRSRSSSTHGAVRDRQITAPTATAATTSTSCQRRTNALESISACVYQGSSRASANSVERFGTTKLKMNASARMQTPSTTSGYAAAWRILWRSSRRNFRSSDSPRNTSGRRPPASPSASRFTYSRSNTSGWAAAASENCRPCFRSAAIAPSSFDGPGRVAARRRISTARSMRTPLSSSRLSSAVRNSRSASATRSDTSPSVVRQSPCSTGARSDSSTPRPCRSVRASSSCGASTVPWTRPPAASNPRYRKRGISRRPGALRRRW